MIRSRWSGWKFETPAVRSRPSATSCDHRLPGRDEVAIVEGGERPVDQEEVKLLQAELLHRLVEGASHVVRAMVPIPELAGDVDLLPWDTGRRDGLTHAALVAVALRGVDVPVPELQGEADDLGRLLGVLAGWLAVRRHVQGAEADLRNRRPVVQGDARAGGHGLDVLLEHGPAVWAILGCAAIERRPDIHIWLTEDRGTSLRVVACVLGPPPAVVWRSRSPGRTSPTSGPPARRRRDIRGARMTLVPQMNRSTWTSNLVLSSGRLNEPTRCLGVRRHHSGPEHVR